jgi:hypothetical protein
MSSIYHGNKRVCLNAPSLITMTVQRRITYCRSDNFIHLTEGELLSIKVNNFNIYTIVRDLVWLIYYIDLH